MSILGNLFGVEIKKVKNDSDNPQVDNKFLRSLYGLLGMDVPATLTDNAEGYVKQGYNQNSILYAVISWVATKAAMVDYIAKDPDGKVLNDHEFLDLLDRPNKMMGAVEFRESYFGNKLITGNTYVYAPLYEYGVDKGKPIDLWVMPSQYVEIISNGWREPVSKYRITIGRQEINIDGEEVVHDKMPNYEVGSRGELYGMSPIKAAARTIAKSNDASIASQKAFQNNGAIGIIADDSGSGGNAFTQSQADALRRGWDKKYSGADKRNKIAFISSRVKWINLGVSPVDLQIIEDQKWNLQDICRVYHVPSALFNDDSASTKQNMVTFRKTAYTDAIVPLVKAFASEWNRKFSKLYGGVRIEPDFTKIPELQPDRKELAEIYSLGVQIGAYTRNEFREKLGDEPSKDPDADRLYFGANNIPLENADLNNDLPDDYGAME